MGVWDFINSAADKLKQNGPNLTPVKHASRNSYGYSCEVVSKINNSAPDLTPVRNACRTSYDYSCVAVSKIHNAVRVDGLQNLYRYWPDGDTRANIGLFAAKFTKNAADYVIKEGVNEGIKYIPGGTAVSKIVSKTLRDVKSENQKDLSIKAVQAKTGRLEQGSSGFITSPEQAEMPKLHGFELGSGNKHLCQNPEAALKVYMMTEFAKSRVLTDLIIREDQKRGEA